MQFIQGFQACRQALGAAQAKRTVGANPELESRVRDICEAVRLEGDRALVRFERQFDCPTLELSGLRVSPSEVEAAYSSLPNQARRALERAAHNIEAFHRAQPIGNWQTASPDGVFLAGRFTPVSRAGLYAPNQRAALPSSVLMVAIPGRVAGVESLALASPPTRDGTMHPMVLAAARVAGVTEIWKLGGAVAVAAFAYGTETVPRVDKIVGPMNQYGTAAKKQLYGVVGIDGLYGPSEVAILADGNEDDAPQIAADLLAQAEHGDDSFVCLISPSQTLCRAVEREVEAQAAQSSRVDVLRTSLSESLILCPGTLDEACALCDEAASEHLEIWSRDAEKLSEKIRHAGAIFLNTPVPLGDYIAGPSHTLPTGGTARFSGGVGVETFLKKSTIIAAPRQAIADLADDLEVLARLEGLPSHADAVRRASGQ